MAANFRFHGNEPAKRGPPLLAGKVIGGLSHGRKNIREYKLDLDIGYLTKSPCRECVIKKSLPRCSNRCLILNQLQERLVDLISCSNNISELETYSLSQKDL